MTNQQQLRRKFLALASGAIAGFIAAPHKLNVAVPR
jgi:hypothetical protein